MILEHFRISLEMPLSDKIARGLGVGPDTCRLLLCPVQKSTLVLAELLFLSAGDNARFSVLAERELTPMSEMMKRLPMSVGHDTRSVSIETAGELAAVLEHWRAEELVILRCKAGTLSGRIDDDDPVFSLKPSGHLHRFASVIHDCGPVSNYSADHNSMECFGTETQIMSVVDALRRKFAAS